MTTKRLLHIGRAKMPTFDRLAVLPDPRRKGGSIHRGYAIVTNQPIHSHHGLAGYKRGYGEPHFGLYAYTFIHWFTAARVAHDIADSGRAVFQGDDL